MNERSFRKLLVEAFGGTGTATGNERSFWNILLTTINGTPTYANNEHEFRRKFVAAVGSYMPDLPEDQLIVEDGDPISVLNSEDDEVATGALAVSSNEASVVLPATVAVVSDSEAIVIGQDTYTITVVDGAITNIVVS